MKLKFSSLAALLTALALLLGGCAGNEPASTEQQNAALPEPSPAAAQQILGDSSTAKLVDVTLYYAADDSSSLTSVTRSIELGENENIASRTVAELLQTGTGTGAMRVTSADTSLLSLELGCGTATVNLSVDAAVTQSPQEYYLMYTAIANTLLDIDGIDAVNLLIGGHSDALCLLPVGAITQKSASITASFAQFQSEQEHFLQEDSGSIERDVLLYFPSVDDAFLLPEQRRMRFTSDDYAAQLIDALKAGPSGEASFSAIPGNLELLAGEPVTRITDQGERVLELNFSSMLANYLAFSGVEDWQLYGSVVLTLCSFMPEIDAVRISVEGQVIDSCVMNEKTLAFEDGYMYRDDFSGKIGSSTGGYYADASGSLQRREFALSQASALSPRKILCDLIEDRTSLPAGLSTVFPEGIYADDVLGVNVRERIAYVNLSANFYSRCQSLSAVGERNVVYAMVNALCELKSVGAVHFLIEGENVDTLSQKIYLKTSLLPNPALGISPEPSADATEAPAVQAG